MKRQRGYEITIKDVCVNFYGIYNSKNYFMSMSNQIHIHYEWIPFIYWVSQESQSPTLIFTNSLRVS